MALVVIIGLIVAVISLLIVNSQQRQAIENYEAELIKKARKGRK